MALNEHFRGRRGSQALWEQVLARELEKFWKTDQTREDYVSFLFRFGGLWFMGLDNEEVNGLVAVVH